MNSTTKLIMIIVIIAYIVSPVDFAPGPLDDVIVLLLGIAANRGVDSDE